MTPYMTRLRENSLNKVLNIKVKEKENILFK